MARPILGWFGVVDERVDYAMVGEMARMRPDWSFAMVGPVVKVDPNLLPHFAESVLDGRTRLPAAAQLLRRVRHLHDAVRDERQPRNTSTRPRAWNTWRPAGRSSARR